MADMRILAWGGTVYDSSPSGSAIEIWSNSLHFEADTGADSPLTMVNLMAPMVKTFHTAAATLISNTVALEWVKVSIVDPTTGVWTTDPVPIVTYTTTNRGGNSGTPPLGQACRITLDDGTRDRRARGGWYIPRFAGTVAGPGRWSSAQITALGTTVSAFLGSMNAYVGGVHVGVYSPTGAAFTTSTRFRIGDVPDNIRRRKNDLRETYAVTAL